MRNIGFSLISMFIFWTAAAQGPRCADVWISSEIKTRFLQQLADLRLDLDLSEVHQSEDPSLPFLNLQFQKRRAEALRFTGWTEAQLDEQIRQTIERRQAGPQVTQESQEKQKDQQTHEVKVALTDPIQLSTIKTLPMIHIPAGKFDFGRPPDPGKPNQEVEIPEAFEISALPMTQAITTRLLILMEQLGTDMNLKALANLAHVEKHADNVDINFQGVSLTLRLDHAMGGISHDWAVKKFIPQLNKLSKSDDEAIQALLTSLIPSHKKGDVYDIPSVQQMQYVLKMAKTDTGEDLDSLAKEKNRAALAKYAVVSKRVSDDVEWQAISDQEPLLIGQQPIYLYTNVREITSDQIEATTPTGPDKEGVATGGFFDHELNTRSWSQIIVQLHWPYKDIGFRLIRRLPH